MSHFLQRAERATLAKEVAEEEAWVLGDRLPLLPTTPAKTPLPLLADFWQWLHLRCVSMHVFHLYNGLLAELLKRLAELQWQGEVKTVGNRLHYTSAVNDSHSIYSTP